MATRLFTHGIHEAIVQVFSLEMIQGAHAGTLAFARVPSSANPSQDPRTKRGSALVALTPAVLSRFNAGPALVRATALGGPQWLRTPPPTVRDVAVNIERSAP